MGCSNLDKTLSNYWFHTPLHCSTRQPARPRAQCMGKGNRGDRKSEKYDRKQKCQELWAPLTIYEVYNSSGLLLAMTTSRIWKCQTAFSSLFSIDLSR